MRKLRTSGSEGGTGTRRPGRFTEGTAPKGAAPATGAMATAAEARIYLPNLASKTLASTTQRLHPDWEAVYGHPVLVAETFVDPTRFAGTSYRAAGWEYLGLTRGFARHHRHYGAPSE